MFVNGDIRKPSYYCNYKRFNPRRGYNDQNVYAASIGAPKYIKQILMDLKGESHSDAIIEEDFDTTLTSMDGPSRQKSNKEIMPLNVT